MCFIAIPKPTVVVVLPSPSDYYILGLRATLQFFDRIKTDLGKTCAIWLEQMFANTHLLRDVF
jgi:hypothetical protein